MNFSRKMIFVVGAALLAACGDKVTVAAPTPPTPAVTKINSVDVAPLSATITAGQSITFTAAVNADAGVTYTTAWSSSVSSITVSSAGVVTTTTASVTPGAAICATATAGTQIVKGCATLVVQAAAVQIPASVSIRSITGVGGLNAPVNPAAVVGAIDITLNVNPGNQTVSKVVLLVGGIRTDSQTFTAAQAAALRFSSDEAVAAQTTFPQIVFSVNTAKFNALTGIPTWMNGTQAVSALLYTTQGGAASAASASVATSLTFANVNGVTGSFVTVGGASAIDGSGYGWKSGGINTTLIPVIYSAGSSAASVTMRISNACDGSGSGARGMAATAPAAGSAAWTASFNNTAAAASGDNVVAFELNPLIPGCAAVYTGGGVQVTADVFDASGNNIVTGFALNGAVRLDNQAPAAPLFFANPNGRSGRWVNGDVVLRDNAIKADGWLTADPTDLGSGGAVAVMKIGADQAAAMASTTVYTTTASLPVTVDAISQCVVLYGRDRLGNTSANPAAAACGIAGGLPQIQYGVDKVAPFISGISTPGSTSFTTTSRRTGANLAGDFKASVADTGAIGNSGMASVNALRATVKLRNTVSAAACIVADPATLATTCDPATLTNNGARVHAIGVDAIGQVWTIVNAEAVNGYYTISAQAVDAAGNVSAVKTRVTMLDNVAPSVTTASLTSAGNANAGFTFTSLASDNLDLQNYRHFVDYLTGPALAMFDVDPTVAVVAPDTVRYRETTARTAINGYNAATFINSNFQLPGTSNAPLTLQGTTAGVFPLATVNAWAATDKLALVVSEVRDQRSLTTATFTNVAGAITTPAATTFTTATSPTTDITDFSFGLLNAGGTAYDASTFTACSGAATRDNGVTAGCQAVALPLVPEASSRTFRVQVTGATGQLLQPFAKVYIVGFNDILAGAGLVKLAELTTVNLFDNGATRRWRWDGTLALDATTFDLLGGLTVAFGGTVGNGSGQNTPIRNIYVIGVDANGRVGLVSQAITVTIKE